MGSMTIGVVGTSFKENELRVPIHPEQLDWIDPGVGKNYSLRSVMVIASKSLMIG